MKTLDIKNNFLAIEKEYSGYENSKIVIQSAPFEKTVSYGKGTGLGPKAILEASHYVEFYDEEFDRELCFEKGIAALKPMNLNKLSPEKALEKIYDSTKALLDDDKLVVTLGGEHTISSAPAKAYFEKFKDLSILQIDAHSDFREEYEGTKYSHACVMKRIAEFTLRIVQVGIRAQCIDESKFIKENNIKTFYSRGIREGEYGNDWISSVLRNLSKNVYITFDVDGFDPSFLPSTGTPEPGGLFWDETISLIKKVGKKKNIVGFDVVELAPQTNDPSSSFTTAKLVYKMLNCAFINK